MHLTEPNFEDLIQNHAHCLTAEGRSQKTIDWYAANLKRFLRFLKSHNMSTSVKDIDIPDVRRFIHHLQSEVVRWEDKPDISDSGRLSPFSVQGYARTIKAFWSWLVEEGYIEEKRWFKKIADWKAKFPFNYDRNSSAIKPQYVVEEICRQTDGKAIITTGVGQNQMWAAQFYRFSRPRQLISSGGLGTMGYGLPAAIGAQVARPTETVIDIDGDHSFNMTMTELRTAVENKLPIKVCILNNGYMGMVRQWQELFYNKRYSKSYLSNPDYATVARALGAVGITVDKKADVPKAVKAMLVEKQPCVVDFRIEREENVWPMVAAGKSLNEMDGLDILERLI